MRNFLRVSALVCLTLLSACATDNLTKRLTFAANESFDGAVQAFRTYRDACANKQLPSSCRAVVVKGQVIIQQAYAAEKAGNSDTVQTLIASVLSLIGVK